MANPFYNKSINIYSYGQYEDDSLGLEVPITREGYKKVRENFKCDIQPYSSKQAEKDYGYSVECTRRMFCDIIPEIIESCLIEYNGEYYKVVETPWDDGYYEILLDKVKDVKIIE